MSALKSIHPVPATWLRDSDLAPFVPAYVRRLVDRRYAARTVRMYVYGVAHFAHWTRRHCVGVRDLSDEIVQRFVDEHLPRCTCPLPVQRCRHQVRAALRQLLNALVDAGVLIERHRPDAIENQVARFDAHMQQARGLAETTRVRRLSVVRSLLQFCLAGDSDSDAMATPSADELRRFIAQELARISPASAGSLAGALRGYLRFLALSGARLDHLLPVIAPPAHWRLAPLPQTLSQSEVARLLDAFPPDLPSHLRGYAMVRCLVDLGLREREVVSLELDDIDWKAGTLRIRKGKSRRVDVMPLPQTTGHAIAAYLRSERPTTVSRCVFVRHVAPLDEPIRPDVVRNTVRLAYLRCGLPFTRVHILRHTLARRLLETGGTLKEVARHAAPPSARHLDDLRQGRHRTACRRGDAMAGERGMSCDHTIQAAVQRYLDERRRLGFALKSPGTELMRFARFADARGHRGPLTLDLQLDWAREHVARTGPVTAARRLEIVRPFAVHHRQFEPATVVPPPFILGHGHRRRAPHIYTDQEIGDLMEACGRMTPQDGLRPLTYRTLFGLIAATGLRISEALKLQVADVDLLSATLTVRQTKFHKSRCLALHASVVQALTDYLCARQRFVGRAGDTPVFATPTGLALSLRTVHHVFARLRDQLGWRSRGEHARPRIHDLRHTMVVRRVQRWNEDGVSIDHAMFWLCTYMGHAKISDTYWYLTGTPELMESVGVRFERFVLQEAGHE